MRGSRSGEKSIYKTGRPHSAGIPITRSNRSFSIRGSSQQSTYPDAVGVLKNVSSKPTSNVSYRVISGGKNYSSQNTSVFSRNHLSGNRSKVKSFKGGK